MALSLDAKAELSKELEEKLIEEQHIKYTKSIAKKADTVPFHRRCFKQQIELDTLAQDRATQANAALKIAQTQRAENLAYEMRQINDEEFKEQKLRQQLRENCPELRDLRRKLDSAYVNKIVHEQIQERAARKRQEQIMERDQIDLLKEAHITEKEYFRKEKEKKIQQQEHYKRELQDQMIFQENARRAKFEEFLKEKKLIDELVLRIQEEEERDMQLKYCAMLKTQEDIRQFKDNQKLWRDKTRERIEQEDLAIQKFIQHKMEQSTTNQEEKLAKEAERARLCDEMAKKMYIERRKQLETDEILSELLEAEERESHERKHREKMEKDVRMRLSIHRSLNAQMEERLENMKKEAERDRRYQEELIAQHAKDEKLELMSKEKKRIRMMQLRRDLEDTIKAERLKKAMNMQILIKEEEVSNEVAEKRRLCIEEERVRMIKEHAENLIGYLPANIMNESELNKLGNDLKLKITCNRVKHS